MRCRHSRPCQRSRLFPLPLCWRWQENTSPPFSGVTLHPRAGPLHRGGVLLHHHDALSIVVAALAHSLAPFVNWQLAPLGCRSSRWKSVAHSLPPGSSSKTKSNAFRTAPGRNPLCLHCRYLIDMVRCMDLPHTKHLNVSILKRASATSFCSQFPHTFNFCRHAWLWIPHGSERRTDSTAS